MSEEELESAEISQFHYFKLHDYDGNNKLDGLELGKARMFFTRKQWIVFKWRLSSCCFKCLGYGVDWVKGQGIITHRFMCSWK